MSMSPTESKCASFSGAGAATFSRKARSAAASSAGASSIGPRSPSRRSMGGWSILKWMSLAPSSTARLSMVFRSIGTRTKDRPQAARPLARCVGDRVDGLHGHLLQAAGGAGVAELAEEHLLHRPPRRREADELERRAGEAVEGPLDAPARVRERGDPA